MPEEFNGPQEGYEKTDANAGVFVAFGVVMALLIIGALLITFGFLRAMEDRDTLTAGKGQNTAAGLSRHTIERGAELEPAPEAERKALTAPAFERLDSYGVVSETPRRVHIPVDKAIDLIAAGQAPYKMRTAGDAQSPEQSDTR
ncbi:MAG: hypothetical protein ACLFTT_05825 [Candidatus Hydrogenedentota bacterium]